MGLVRLCLGLAVVVGILEAQAPIVSDIAGRGVRGFDGDGGPAASAAVALANLQNACDPLRFEQTSHIAVDAKSNIYFTDSENQRVRRIDAAGVITTVAGSGAAPQTNARCEPTAGLNDGPDALAARLFNPSGIVVNPNGNLIVADQQNNRIRQITPGGAISTIAGNGLHNFYSPGVTATASPLDWPSGLALDAAGTLYFAELHSNRVARLSADGRLATVAGTGFPGFNGDRIAANTATLTKPAGIAIDRSGALLIADTGNHRIRRVASDGIITTIAGTGSASFCGDGGAASQACLNTPMDVKADALGNIYIADAVNNRIRRIDSTGIITSVADGLNLPCAIAVDANNDLLIIDWQNYRIRKLSFAKPPAIGARGIVNGASFQAGVAPGAIFSIFGENFGTSASEASVAVNGVNAPLFVVTPGQVNAQIPYGIAPGQATAIVTTRAGASAPAGFPVTAVAPGIFTYGGTNRAIVANEDGTLNSPEHPLARGLVLVCYVTGLGAVTPEVPTGEHAPFDHYTYSVAEIGASVGGVPARVFFAGLTPGYVGLGQVNLYVPADAPTGDAIPLVIQGSQAAMVSIR